MHSYQSTLCAPYYRLAGKAKNVTGLANRRIFTALLILLPFANFLSGCATTAGVNQHQNFAKITPEKLSVRAEVAGATDLETVTTLKVVFVAVPGPGAVLGSLAGNYVGQRVGQSIVGKFQAGKAFCESVSHLSAGEAAVSDETLKFRLVHFEQYIPAKGGLAAHMTFETILHEAGETVVSSYVSEWEPVGISPNDQKNFLREFIEQSLAHWSARFMAYDEAGKSSEGRELQFPPTEKGAFSGKDVQCRYELFIRP